MGSRYDVIVVGGGPGGATAARFCAEAGLKTLLVEKEKMPRYKACGGCLSRKTVRLLDLDLSRVIETTIYKAKFTYRLKDSFTIGSAQPIAYMVMRDRFDQLLVERASEKGTKVFDGVKVVGLEEREDGVQVELSGGEKVFGHYVIGADGPGSIVARSSSLRPPEGCGRGMGVECEVPFEALLDLPAKDFQQLHLDFGDVPNGYGWVFPKKEGFSIGVGGMFTERVKVDLRRHLHAFLRGLGYVREGRVKRVAAHRLPAFYDERQKVSRGRVLLVGDAAYLMDPLMGEGIYYAIRSGMLAAEAIVRSKEHTLPVSDFYQLKVEEEIFESLKWALPFSRFVFRFTGLAYRTLKRYRELADLYLLVLEGKESYRGFVSRVKERMRDLLGGRLSERIRKAMAGR